MTYTFNQYQKVEILSRNIEFMISETYAWFSKSSVRQEHFRNIFKTINDGIFKTINGGCEPKCQVFLHEKFFYLN